jgi:hypothetical protein
MNYLIFDTEQTYNYGYIVIDEKGDTLYRQNLVLTNNFENRAIIGENTYKRKLPIYQKDPDAKFMASSDGAKQLADIMKKYKVQQIISHNISEDRRQLELLHQQTGVAFPEIPFYDSINLVKILFPNNTQTGLEAIVSDITGLDVKQTHTALADCDMLLKLIAPIIEYMPYFIKYHEIFAHDSDYEVTQKFFTNFGKILPLPRNVKEVQAILGMDGSTGDKKKVNNFIKKIETEYGLWVTAECVEYSEKTGKPLKTPGLEMRAGSKSGMDDAAVIGALYANLDKIAQTIVTACISFQASQETDEMIIEKLNVYKATFDEEFAARDAALAQREADFIAEMKRKEAEFEKKCADRDAAFKATVANALMEKIKPIVDGGLFNSDAKTVKNFIKSGDKNGLYNFFMK